MDLASNNKITNFIFRIAPNSFLSVYFWMFIFRPSLIKAQRAPSNQNPWIKIHLGQLVGRQHLGSVLLWGVWLLLQFLWLGLC